MAKQVQRAIGWVAAFLLAVGMLFLPVSKAYAGPVSGGSPGSGEMRGVWVSYLDWNGWAKDEAGYKKAMDQTLDLCVQMEMRCIRHSISRGRNLPLENRERIRGMIRWHMRCRRRISGACSFMRGSIRTGSRGI